MEKLIAERIIQLAGLSMTAELEKILTGLVKSAKEGHLCDWIEDASRLPKALYGEGKPLVLEGNRLYLQRNWELETRVLEKISHLLARVPKESSARFKENLSLQENLQEAQRKAISEGFEKMFTLFTGGPGTGKTFTAGCFIRLLAASRDKRLKVAIAAPTGKAAANLESAVLGQGPLGEKLKCESTTLHRLLRLQPGMQKLQANWTIDADLVVVDEASMLDVPLLLHLLNAIGPNTRLLLLGDPDQLPPVEGSSLFKELADLFGQKLERSMRMGTGDLLEFANSIRNGNVKRIENEAIGWLEMKEFTEWVDWIIKRLPDPISSEPPHPEEQKIFRVLSALRQGPFGSDAMNREILARYVAMLVEGQWLTVPIMIAQNDSKQQLYNGTTGVLVRKAFEKTSFAYFEGGKKIPESNLPRYEIAFCLSVHKSQGSEYEEVMLLFPSGSENFGREALYTGVTRAKKRVNIWIEDKTLENLLKTETKKRSGFTERYRLR